ncbi:G-protein alpha subunit-domain-containing protein, partial [Favolaschia claudopus]
MTFSANTLILNIMILALVSGTQGTIIESGKQGTIIEEHNFDDTRHLNVGVIVGGGVGGVAFIVTLIFLLFYYHPRRRAARLARVQALTTFVAGGPAGSYVVRAPPAAYVPGTYGPGTYPVVKPSIRGSMFDSHKIELKTQSGFFLDDLQRICDENYIPTTNDILRTRVHNPYADGPEKHDIEGESSWKAGTLTAYEMRGALTTSEQAPWAQFVDNVTCLFFLIPISAFDEVYQENGIEFNPLEQSFKQWRAICSNNLLASVNLTVCITKIDILRHKIQSGKQFSQYVTSYLDQPNDADAILAYVSQKVKSIHRQLLSTYKYKGDLSVTYICATNPSDICSLMY